MDRSAGDSSTVTATGYRRFPDGLPDELLDLDDLALLRALAGPTLIRVPGAGTQAPRAVATLLHGNESTGYRAMLRILRRRRRYPFDLYVIVGNVRAALDQGPFGHRYLDGQADFNRVWGLDGRGQPGSSVHGHASGSHGALRAEADAAVETDASGDGGALQRAAGGILDELRASGLESAVDVHNNSGSNPFYAIVTHLEPATVNLATLFTTTLLHWDLRVHTLMEALDDCCAAIAVECGRDGRPESLAFAVDGLRRYLGEPPLDSGRIVRDYDLLGGLRKVSVRAGLRFAFGGDLDDDVDLVVAADADAANFRPVPPGYVIARVRPGVPDPLVAIDAAGADVTAEHFAVVDGRVVTTRQVIPVMMTRTVSAARKDCLFYLADERPPPDL